jgi:hypothetical protein
VTAHEVVALELAVHNLVGRYCNEVSTADIDRWSETWANDATWSIPGEGVLVGLDAICESFARIRATYLLCVQEILSGSVEVVDATHARARWYVRELQWSQRDAEVVGSELIGIYDDEVARHQDGDVRFSSRDFALLYSGPVAMTGRFHRAARELSATMPPRAGEAQTTKGSLS